MDRFTYYYERYVYWAEYMDDGLFAFILKGCLVLLIPLALCKIAIIQGSKSKALQAGCMIIGVLLGASWPVPRIDNAPHVKSFIVALCLLSIFTLPAILPQNVLDNLVLQKRATLIIYSLFLLLFILQLLGGM